MRFGAAFAGAIVIIRIVDSRENVLIPDEHQERYRHGVAHCKVACMACTLGEQKDI